MWVCPPSEMHVERAPEGKPRLVHPRDFRFNLSHSGGIGVVAVARAREVGIDVEGVRPLDDLEGLVGKRFSAYDRGNYFALEPCRVDAAESAPLFRRGRSRPPGV